MSNKFRIEEQRGVFRIRKCERVVSFDKPLRFGKWAHNDDIHLKWGGWKKVIDYQAKPTKVWCPFSGIRVSYPQAGFDTYKKAENYIKKFYGSTGVDAIEKPEWRTV